MNVLHTTLQASMEAPLSSALWLSIALLGAVLLIAACLIMLAWRRTKHLAAQGITATANVPLRGAHHRKKRFDTIWRKRVAAVRKHYAHGEITDTQAYVALANLLRWYASQHSNHAVQALTLDELGVLPLASSAQPSFDRLRQVLRALYPREFALTFGAADGDAASVTAQGQDMGVEQACDWTLQCMEHWGKTTLAHSSTHDVGAYTHAAGGDAQ